MKPINLDAHEMELAEYLRTYPDAYVTETFPGSNDVVVRAPGCVSVLPLHYGAALTLAKLSATALAQEVGQGEELAAYRAAIDHCLATFTSIQLTDHEGGATVSCIGFENYDDAREWERLFRRAREVRGFKPATTTPSPAPAPETVAVAEHPAFRLRPHQVEFIRNLIATEKTLTHADDLSYATHLAFTALAMLPDILKHIEGAPDNTVDTLVCVEANKTPNGEMHLPPHIKAMGLELKALREKQAANFAAMRRVRSAAERAAVKAQCQTTIGEIEVKARRYEEALEEFRAAQTQ